MRTLINVILILQFGILSAQQSQSKLIIGTWRFEKECDFRTEHEIYKDILETSCGPMTENGLESPDRTFKSNGEYTDYYTTENIRVGNWKLEKTKLSLNSRISKKVFDSRKELMERYLKEQLITKGEDGKYYTRPVELNIKNLTDDRLEFGSEKLYRVWKRIK